MYCFTGPLCNFLLGEAKLEMFLEECAPTDGNIGKARAGLADAKKCLLIAAGEQGVKVSFHILSRRHEYQLLQ